MVPRSLGVRDLGRWRWSLLLFVVHCLWIPSVTPLGSCRADLPGPSPVPGWLAISCLLSRMVFGELTTSGPQAVRKDLQGEALDSSCTSCTARSSSWSADESSQSDRPQLKQPIDLVKDETQVYEKATLFASQDRGVPQESEERVSCHSSTGGSLDGYACEMTACRGHPDRAPRRSRQGGEACTTSGACWCYPSVICYGLSNPSSSSP
eukprot:jgi/Botrbrau1/3349/Bobra.0048s0043.1